MKKWILLILALTAVMLLCGAVTASAEGAEKGGVAGEESAATPVIAEDNGLKLSDYLKENVLPYATVGASALGGTAVALITMIGAIKNALEKLKTEKDGYYKGKQFNEQLGNTLEQAVATCGETVEKLDKTAEQNAKIADFTKKLKLALILVCGAQPSLVKRGVAKQIAVLLEKDCFDGDDACSANCFGEGDSLSLTANDNCEDSLKADASDVKNADKSEETAITAAGGGYDEA